MLLRSKIIVCFVCAAFCAVIIRLFYMQVIKYDFYKEKAVANQTRDVIVSPSRGTIYDRNMKALATSASAEMITLDPKLVKDDEQAKLIAHGLSEILGVSYETVYKKATKKSSYEIIKRSVEKETADLVRQFISDNSTEESPIKAISSEPDSKRYYPYGDFAAGVIGFMGTDEGLAGLEAYYEKTLRGITGRIISAKNARGIAMPFKYERYYEAQDGDNLILTIDEGVQHYLEKNLEIAIADNDVQNKATGIIMNVKTGEILAMATKPDYDPASPFEITDEYVLEQLAGLEGEEYKTAYNNALQDQWQSRALTEPYEPGSTFKIITSAIAIEENVLSDSETFYCPGYTVLNSTRIGCWKSAGHGTQTFLQAMQNSCNPAFVEIGQKIGTATFRKYFKNFGFTEKTGIDLGGEANGVYHSDDNFKEIELAVASFGQRFKATPIQLITAVSAVANGGYLMKPYIVKQTTDANGNIKSITEPTVVRQVISESTSKKLCEMLEQVVAKGSGKNAYVAGYRVAGKTGTSQKMDIVDENGNEVGLRIASFVGFAPANDPQIAVLVLLDEPMGPVKFGGQIAAPVVRRIFNDVLPYLNIEPQYTEEELKAQDISIPSLIGMTADEAKKTLSKKGISYRTVGSGDTVTNQTPNAFAKIPGTATVILYLGAEKPTNPVTIPDVSGMSVAQAKSVLERAGLYLKGAGAVSSSSVIATKQSPAAGEQASPGTVITVDFSDPNDRVN